MPNYVYRAWSRNGLHRVYVQDGDTKLGHVDVTTGVQVADSYETATALADACAAFAARLTGSTATNPDDDEFEDTTPAAAEPTPPPLPWTDLALNLPGASIADITTDSYRAGVVGEQRTAGQLSILPAYGWRILHSVPLTSRKDIDHLAIGPSGVFAINTKATTYVVDLSPDTIKVDGYKKLWADDITRDAQVAGDALTVAARFPITVTPLISLWAGHVIGTHPLTLTGPNLAYHLLSLPPLYTQAWVDVVYATARRSDTWENATHL